MTAPISTETQDGVTSIWLDQPERGNAFSAALVAALDTALDAAVAAGARLIILRGRGRNFCTGLDLSEIETETDGDLALRAIRIELLLQKLHGLPIPSLAIAGGRVFGAGADLFAVCDHRIALPGASFTFPGPAFGLVLGTNRLAGLIGEAAARRVLLAGQAMDAESALAQGFATAVLEEAALEPAIAAIRGAALRLEPVTVAALHRRTRRADDAGDLAALARSVARPGLRQRILDYRASMMAARGKPAA